MRGDTLPPTVVSVPSLRAPTWGQRGVAIGHGPPVTRCPFLRRSTGRRVPTGQLRGGGTQVAPHLALGLVSGWGGGLAPSGGRTDTRSGHVGGTHVVRTALEGISTLRLQQALGGEGRPGEKTQGARRGQRGRCPGAIGGPAGPGCPLQDALPFLPFFPGPRLLRGRHPGQLSDVQAQGHGRQQRSAAVQGALRPSPGGRPAQSVGRGPLRGPCG